MPRGAEDICDKGTLLISGQKTHETHSGQGPVIPAGSCLRRAVGRAQPLWHQLGWVSDVLRVTGEVQSTVPFTEAGLVLQQD